MQDLITIIVPVYNVENYLEESIRSIINQTYLNIEILAINDGSLDNSLRILEKLSTQDKRIKIISQKNKGLSGARNTGIKYSKGKYLLFLDSDDIFSTNTIIQDLYNIIKKDDSDIVIFKYRTKSEKTKILKNIEIGLTKSRYTLEEFCQEIPIKNKKYYGFIPAWSKL
ncbi:glycosyltransferase family 2 protein, partial [Cetobacterium sp.]|uniref:glycosyltransferase family 2 protein n=1 Tax=Cetobacterium sp. TaxID=2071632 RepID=UPI003F34EC11